MMPDIFSAFGFGSTPVNDTIVYVWLLLNDFLIVTVWLSLQSHDLIMNFICTNLPDCDEQIRCCGTNCEICLPCTAYSRFVSKRKTCTKLTASFLVGLSQAGLLVFMLSIKFQHVDGFVLGIQNV